MEFRYTDGTILTESEVRKKHSNTSFPRGTFATAVEGLGYVKVQETPSPSPSSNLKQYVRDGVEKNSADNWVYKWKEVDMHSDYTGADGKTITKKSQDDAYLLTLDEAQKNFLRIEREPLLVEADWQIHKIEDASGDASAWRSYRQKLREITDGDIYNVTWPTKP